MLPLRGMEPSCSRLETSNFGRRTWSDQLTPSWREMEGAWLQRVPGKPPCPRKQRRLWKNPHTTVSQNHLQRGRESENPVRLLQVPQGEREPPTEVSPTTMVRNCASGTPRASHATAQILVRMGVLISVNIALRATSTLLVLWLQKGRKALGRERLLGLPSDTKGTWIFLWSWVRLQIRSLPDLCEGGQACKCFGEGRFETALNKTLVEFKTGPLPCQLQRMTSTPSVKPESLRTSRQWEGFAILAKQSAQTQRSDWQASKFGQFSKSSSLPPGSTSWDSSDRESFFGWVGDGSETCPGGWVRSNCTPVLRLPNDLIRKLLSKSQDPDSQVIPKLVGRRLSFRYKLSNPQRQYFPSNRSSFGSCQTFSSNWDPGRRLGYGSHKLFQFCWSRTEGSSWNPKNYIIDSGWADAFHSWPEVVEAVGEQAQLTPLACIIKQAHGREKIRLVVDMRRSSVNRQIDLKERVLLPRVYDVAEGVRSLSICISRWNWIFGLRF